MKTKHTNKPKPKPGGLTSATEIIDAGGPDKRAEKVGYESKNIKISGIIRLTDHQLEEALAACRR